MGEMLPYSLKQAGYVIGLYAYEGSAYKNNGEEEQVLPHKKGSLEDIAMDVHTSNCQSMGSFRREDDTSRSV